MAHGGCSLRRRYDYNFKSATHCCTFVLFAYLAGIVPKGIRKNIVPLWYIFCYKKMNDLRLSVYAVVRRYIGAR